MYVANSISVANWVLLGILSVALDISGTIHHMIVFCGTQRAKNGLKMVPKNSSHTSYECVVFRTHV